jgi:hypothetical protein
MNEIDLWLERLYWIAMISVPFLAIWAGRIALRQVQTASQQIDAALQEAQTTKLLKMLQHVEEQRVLDARHLVMTEIRRQEEEGKNWWENDERLQRAAEQLCASYDHLGGSSSLMDLTVWDSISWRDGAKALFMLTQY